MYEFLEEIVERNMTSPAKTVVPEMTVGDLLLLFAADDLDAYPVVSNRKLVGIVTKADALKAFALNIAGILPHYDDMMRITVDKIMSRRVLTVDTETKLQRVLQLIAVHHFKSLPIVDRNNHLKGMIAREDVIRALTRNRAKPCHWPHPLSLTTRSPDENPRAPWNGLRNLQPSS